jgi:NDP-sugar pyrophosphorylase family protein
MVQVYSIIKHIIDIVPFFTMKADNLFSMNINHTTEFQQATVVKGETEI